MTRPPRRTSRRKRSSPRCGPWTASTGGGSFAPWLHRIVVNRAIDHARARELRREVSGAEVQTAAADAHLAPSDDVLAALAALPPDQRAVIVMRHLLGFTPGEIARALGLPRGTVNSRLRRGLDGLQEVVER